MLRGLYHLTLRGTEGMMQSIVRMMGKAEVNIPDYSTFSRRSILLEVALNLQKRCHAIHLVLDTTWLKIYGEGEWKVRMHGWSKRRLSPPFTLRNSHVPLQNHLRWKPRLTKTPATKNRRKNQSQNPQHAAKNRCPSLQIKTTIKILIPHADRATHLCNKAL